MIKINIVFINKFTINQIFNKAQYRTRLIRFKKMYMFAYQKSLANNF